MPPAQGNSGSIGQALSAIVLGAGGFIGRHVCRALAARHIEVVGVGHGEWRESEWRSWGLRRWVQADISVGTLDGIGLAAAPCCVINCAGSGAVSYSYQNPIQDFERAALTTAAALEWARIRLPMGSRVVLVSSAAVYGDQGDTDTTESSTCAPVSPYGYHKLAAETLCNSYSRFFNVSVSIVRLFSVYGEGLRKQLLWDALNKISRGDRSFFGTGHELRDWIHVDDAARLLCAAATVPQSKMEIYNGGHEKVTTAQLLARLMEASGEKGLPEFNGKIHVGNPRRLTADFSHARRHLSWEPGVCLQEGLPRYVSWFRQQSASAGSPF